MVFVEALQAGTLFPPGYRILHPLGQGAMGAIYVAEQLATGARRALKIMRPEIVSDPRLLQLFEQEARIGHRIESDHIVHVIDAGVDSEHSLPWLVMELLEGEDLGSYLRREGTVSRKKTRTILSQLCHGLSAAHEARIVHRDLKPENIFLSKPRLEGRDIMVKILDFGIARFLAGSPANTIPVGTPLWMAPEQAKGENVTPATDIWSLGLLVFRMLTGCLYWVNSNRDAISILHEILYTPLVSATDRALHYGRSHCLPDGFDEWFGQCVTRDLISRFASAKEATEPLLKILSEQDSSVPHITPGPGLIRPRSPQPPGAAYDRSWYVVRKKEEREAMNYMTFAGKPAVLWGPSRFGKTWLLTHCLDTLQNDFGFETIVISASLLDHDSLDTLLRALASEIVDARKLSMDPVSEVWNRPTNATSKLTRLMERHILPQVQNALVLAIDGADAVWRSSFQDDFFALLRAWAENHNDPWPKLRLMLTVSTTPALLIQDVNRSPFNLTTPIALGDLDASQVVQLARLHDLNWTLEEIGRVMQLVGGHPYLVRLLMHRTSLHETPLSDLLDPGAGPEWVLFDAVQRMRSWLERMGLVELALRLLRAPDERLDTEDLQRLIKAGVLVEEPSGRRRLRNRMYEIAITGLR